MTRALTVIAVCVATAMGTSYATGVRYNVTPSMPMGIYRTLAIAGPIHRGEIVTLCLEPDAAALGRARDYLTGGECPGDVELLIKTVIAVPGDRVEVTDGGITVNGSPIPHSQALPRDDQGRLMSVAAIGAYRVAPAEVWVIGTTDPRSFDSRYFGPVPIASLRGSAKPLFVNQSENNHG